MGPDGISEEVLRGQYGQVSAKRSTLLTGHHDLQGLKGMDLVMGYPCNVRCTFCHQADYSTKRVLDRRIWREALLPAYEVVRDINMQGGEPTVSK
jgi:sulfatase maturation enzyme AslB (radical SAM superfamily)